MTPSRPRRRAPAGASVLVVDDVRPMAEAYAADLKRLGGYRTSVASGGAAALEALGREVVDCVILDLEMPGLDGFGVLREMQHRDIRVPVIVYTAAGSYRRCVEAVRLGAFSFVDKEEPMERVVQQVELALHHTELRDRIEHLEERASGESRLLGESPAMARLKNEIARVADIPSPVLVLGESGTGKELVAGELHRQSSRRDRALVPVNCGAFSEGLVDSDLFGHVRGAFTNAHAARKGAFERAHRGTLFLDEIGELPPAVQARLLRVLEVGEVTRMGGEEPVSVDVRVVAATHRDLDADAASGAFRQDLLYRLNVHVLRVPPLRERPEDVAMLASHFATTLPAKMGRAPRPIGRAALAELRARRWERNNVRELRNTIERMIIASDGPTLDAPDLPPDLPLGTTPGGAPGGPTGLHGTTSPDPGRADGDRIAGPGLLPRPAGSWQEQKRAAERLIIERALEDHGWVIQRTARALGLADHSSLIKIMRRLGIKRPVGAQKGRSKADVMSTDTE